MPEPLSRRTLLLGGSALAVMAACGKKGDDDIDIAGTPTTRSQKDVLSVVQAGFGFQTGIDERVTFALFEGVPASLYTGGAEVRVGFQKPGTKVLTDTVPAQRRADGIEERPYYVVHHEFDVAGTWGLQAQIGEKRRGNLTFEVVDAAQAAWPTLGDELPKVKTPTTADSMGVDPICTRSPEACPLHATSLDALIGNGKPTIVLLATPALCVSATCGPVLDILLTETEAVRSRVNVVHVEVWKDETGKKLSPAFAAFKTPAEPVAYFADNRGRITERFNGPFDRSEAREAIARLL